MIVTPRRSMALHVMLSLSSCVHFVAITGRTEQEHRSSGSQAEPLPTSRHLTSNLRSIYIIYLYLLALGSASGRKSFCVISPAGAT
ncbi:hypothetical protein BC834DRAFT_866822 [Gloeopeniophorella convolvens]|nr:hypothetical protein BC834DRAFT_866822 [Gloeopeniophorella convolvens]